MPDTKVIRFDWAIKNILRDKANFDILEGFLSALLKTDIIVLEILESESNQEEKSKFNRVDLLVKDSDGKKIIIEVQNQREADYLERLLYGTSKAVVENLDLGKPYKDIDKIISISILYFNLGTGDDYVYYGKTTFKGIHSGNPLLVKEKVIIDEKIYFKEKQNIFPEYYLIQVQKFQDVINESLDEWIYMFKYSKVEDTFTSKNIDKAKSKLDILTMPKDKRKSYERYLEGLAIEKDVIETAKEEGLHQGLQQGLQEGLQKGIEQGLQQGIQQKAIETAMEMYKRNFKKEDILAITQITEEEFNKHMQSS